MGLIEKKGSHATSKSRYGTIKANGFQKSRGRAGKGVYFWADSHYCRKLAVGWYAQSLADGQYRNDEDPSGVVLFATLSTEETCFLDLENQTLKDQIAVLAERQRLGSRPSNHDIAALYDLFIKRIEKARNIVYNVLAIRVAPPRDLDYPIAVVGAPLCYIARITDCITIYAVEEI